MGNETSKNYIPYGTNSEMDKLVDSKSVEDRKKAAEAGYGLDRLVDDDNFEVRLKVACFCNGDKDICNKLANDTEYFIRNEIVFNCNGDKDILTRLMKDEDEGVRNCAIDQYTANYGNNPYQETNFRIEPTSNNTYLVYSDSERFGKDAIVFESWNRDDCVDYVSKRRPPLNDVCAYIVPDLKPMVTREAPVEPIEYYDTVDEAIQRYSEIQINKGTQFLRECDEINPNSNLPYTRLVIGICNNEHTNPVDVITVQGNKNTLIDDFTRRADINTDRACIDAIKHICEEIGVQQVCDYDKQTKTTNLININDYTTSVFDLSDSVLSTVGETTKHQKTSFERD